MILDTNTILLLGSLGINALMFVGIFVLMFQITKFKNIGREITKNDHRTKLRMAHKIEDMADVKLEAIIKETAKKLQEEIEIEFKKVDDAAYKQLEQVSKFTRDQQEVIVSESQAMVASLVSKMEEEINVYKQAQMKRVDTSIHAILVDATKEIIGKSMNVSEHEELVEKALDRAKREKFFS